MGGIEALYIFDEHNTPLLEHSYTGRPAASTTLLPLFLAHTSPRPPLIYLAQVNPPTLLYSLVQDQLLFLCPCSSEIAPLQVLEFLHRVADVLEDYLGAPLLAGKIEANYHVVAQLLGEMVDGGAIACTEPNALRDLVDAPNFIKNLLGGVGLAGSAPGSLSPPSSSSSFSLPGRPSPRLGPAATSQTNSPVPWRRANVRHTSNEMYVDMVETLAVMLSPSGRPLCAMACGTIAFTAKVSGVPHLTLQLSCPGGIQNAVSLPAFHPCVRLNRWNERPGELSFVPPDGSFVLAGYEVDLLGSTALDSFSTPAASKSLPKLNLPVTVSVHTGLGPTGSDLEVRLLLNPRFTANVAVPQASTAAGRGGRGVGALAFSSSGTTAAPVVEEMLVNVPLPPSVRNLADLRVMRGSGEATYSHTDRCIEWRMSSREISLFMSQDRGGSIGAGAAVLRATLVGQDERLGTSDHGGPVTAATATATAANTTTTTTNPYDYDESSSSHQSAAHPLSKSAHQQDAEAKRVKLNKTLMPSCATVSFSIKGWLPSGIKVESLTVDSLRSRGLGSGVTPYKGVKYLCVSRKGVECRC